MNGWMVVWKVTLIGGLALFAGLTLWVAVRGWRDLRALLRHLRDRDRG